MNEKVSVIMVYNSQAGTVMPYKLKWKDRDYIITKLGYYHAVRRGRTVIHIFHVTDGTLDFSLECNGDNLHWILKEVIDGSTN